jgi:hypothetical protein
MNIKYLAEDSLVAPLYPDLVGKVAIVTGGSQGDWGSYSEEAYA